MNQNAYWVSMEISSGAAAVHDAWVRRVPIQPVLGGLGAARDYNLPIMAGIFNNKKYAAMQGRQLKIYPDEMAAEADVYHGTDIHAPDFVNVAELVGGYFDSSNRYLLNSHGRP
jgi:hypothetical protein